MARSVIAGMGMYLPEQVLSSEEVERRAGYERFGLKTGLVKMLTGCASRHYAAEGEHCSDIAARAGREALADAGIVPADIDAVLFCSITQDFAEPATVNVVMDKLDIRNAYSFDIKNACNAFLSGLDVADSLIKSDKAEHVLVVSGEALSRWTKFDYEDKDELLQRAPAALSVGDGGGAFVVSRNDAKDGRGIVASLFRTVPEVWNNNVIWGGGVVYPKAGDKLYIPGTTKALIDMHQDVSRAYIPPVLEESGWGVDDIDCIVVSQVAKWITKNIRAIVGVEKEVMPEIVESVGNVGAANIPIMACEARRLGILKRGSRTLMLGGAVGANMGVLSAVM
ncbi:3-oxoacyl-ACP synthase III family protein [Slackia exigua]|nr:ketoacyl-ACP synthase III [Slackia exigua]MCQ5091256.1 ketoacyl-ACP synthase III [Slackia exigua]STN98778.1 3-oxoacyl-[acyl-carrier-protein] synthase 3 [Slackia exigua]